MEKFQLRGRFKVINLLVSSNHVVTDRGMSQVYRVRWDDDSACDALTCTARGGITVYLQVRNREVHQARAFAQLVEQVNRRRECAVLPQNNPPLILSPQYHAWGSFGKAEAKTLMKDVLDACEALKAKRLRMTQFCLLQTENNEPEFEGVLEAISDYLDSEGGIVESIFFDVDERRIDEFILLLNQ